MGQSIRYFENCKLPNLFLLTPDNINNLQEKKHFWKNCKHNWLLWVKVLYILPKNSPTHFHWPQSTSSSSRKIAKVTYEVVSFMFPLDADDGVTRFFSSLPSSFAPQLHQIWSEESDSDLLICYHQSNNNIAQLGQKLFEVVSGFIICSSLSIVYINPCRKLNLSCDQ